MMPENRKYWTPDRVGMTVFLSLVFLVVFYIKQTYVLNLFDDRYPLFIERFFSQEIYLLPNPAYLDVQGLFSTRIISVFIFQVAFFGLSAWLFWLIFSSRRVLRMHTALFLLLSLAMVIFFALNIGIGKETFFYTLARIVKDFFQSPLYILVMFLIFRLWMARVSRSMAGR
jgi:hypothetical protein